MNLKKNYNQTNQSSHSRSLRSLKHILKALCGATVFLGATFSLFLTSAQAASFVTTFDTEVGDISLEWSGSDEDKNGFIEFSELFGSVGLTAGGKSIDFGLVSNFVGRSFEYNTISRQISTEASALDLGASSISFVRSNGTGLSFVGRTEAGAFASDSVVWLSQETLESGTTSGSGGGGVATTPEPNLTLGFITLGGLMLGSRKKVKA